MSPAWRRHQPDQQECWVDATLRPQPTPWHALPDEQYQAEVDGLIKWAQWLAATYGSLGLPACWPQHEHLVHYLGAVRDAWRNAYHPASDAGVPLIWIHELDDHLGRIRGWAMRVECDHSGDHVR